MAFVSAKAAGRDVDVVAMGLGCSSEGPRPMQIGSVSVIPVHGTILHRASSLQESSGVVGVDRIGTWVDAAARDSTVRSIVLDVNSPGGTVPGVQELAARVRAARKSKRVVAHVNSLAASAAYWIAAQAGEVVVTPSGSVGSIGVYAAHQDLSEALEREGVKVTLVSAGKHKVEGNPFEPLSEDARAAMQERIDAIYERFVADVAKGRGAARSAVRRGYGEGRVVLADRAVELGMADRVGTMDDVMRRLTRAKQASTMRAQSPDDALDVAHDEDETENAHELRELADRIRALTGGTTCPHP